jgi:hypothetical protein
VDHLYSRTETPNADDAVSALPQEASGDGDGPIGIMSALPRRRPHRRSALRDAGAPAVTVAAATGGAAQTAAAVAQSEPVEERHLRPVGSTPAERAPRRSRPRRKTLPPPREPAPGIGRLALDGAVETAKFPWRVAAELARQAAGSITGTLRR